MDFDSSGLPIVEMICTGARFCGRQSECYHNGKHTFNGGLATCNCKCLFFPQATCVTAKEKIPLTFKVK